VPRSTETRITWAQALEVLNHQVTNLVVAARGLREGSPEWEAVHRHLSYIEEAIAGITDPADVVGEASRLGAVAAASSAGDRDRARLLAQRFLAEDLNEAVRAAIAAAGLPLRQ
jgi:hypothetical protein